MTTLRLHGVCVTQNGDSTAVESSRLVLQRERWRMANRKELAEIESAQAATEYLPSPGAPSGWRGEAYSDYYFSMVGWAARAVDAIRERMAPFEDFAAQ